MSSKIEASEMPQMSSAGSNNGNFVSPSLKKKDLSRH